MQHDRDDLFRRSPVFAATSDAHHIGAPTSPPMSQDLEAGADADLSLVDLVSLVHDLETRRSPALGRSSLAAHGNETTIGSSLLSDDRHGGRASTGSPHLGAATSMIVADDTVWTRSPERLDMTAPARMDGEWGGKQQRRGPGKLLIAKNDLRLAIETPGPHVHDWAGSTSGDVEQSPRMLSSLGQVPVQQRVTGSVTLGPTQLSQLASLLGDVTCQPSPRRASSAPHENRFAVLEHEQPQGDIVEVDLRTPSTQGRLGELVTTSNHTRGVLAESPHATHQQVFSESPSTPDPPRNPFRKAIGSKSSLKNASGQSFPSLFTPSEMEAVPRADRDPPFPPSRDARDAMTDVNGLELGHLNHPGLGQAGVLVAHAQLVRSAIGHGFKAVALSDGNDKSRALNALTHAEARTNELLRLLHDTGTAGTTGSGGGYLTDVASTLAGPEDLEQQRFAIHPAKSAADVSRYLMHQSSAAPSVRLQLQPTSSAPRDCPTSGQGQPTNRTGCSKRDDLLSLVATAAVQHEQFASFYLPSDLDDSDDYDSDA